MYYASNLKVWPEIGPRNLRNSGRANHRSRAYRRETREYIREMPDSCQPEADRKHPNARG